MRLFIAMELNATIKDALAGIESTLRSARVVLTKSSHPILDRRA